MKTRRSYWQETLKSTFWFTPAVTAISLLGLLLLAELLENKVPRDLPLWLWRGNTVEGTRLLLSSIATAAMTVVGVLFSVTIVVLQQVSQQYTPRVIENFIRSLFNQFVLGFYIGTFGYAMLLLRSLPEEGRAPLLAPFIAILLAMICLALLIYFVHHIAKGIKSNTILAGITRQAVATLADLQNDMKGEGSHNLAPAGDPATQFEATFTSRYSGYLQDVNWQELRSLLSGIRWRGELCVTPGDYLHQGARLICIHTSIRLEAERESKIVALFHIDLTRTHSQDVRFGVRQMADMALRALSPGINDPTTAIEALNEIGTVLLHYTRHCDFSRPVVFPDGSWLQLKQPSYKAFVDLCFNEIALAGRDHYSVQERIQDILRHCQQLAGSERAHILSVKGEQLRREFGSVSGSTLFS